MAQASICEKTGYGAVDVCCVNVGDLLQYVARKTLWMKERSNHWWEHVVKSTFAPQDWLENFHMSQYTFMYLCNELQSSIKKCDTELRRVVPTACCTHAMVFSDGY